MDIKFTKTGLLLLESKNGDIYIFEGENSIREIAEYIWEDKNLSNYRLEDIQGFRKNKKFKIPDFKDKKNRLRAIDNILEDTYYQDI